jgi:hypothetical protein
LAEDINGLAQHYGEAFGRQSERDMPKCKFKQGITKGKLMAKEFRGILLVIAAVLRCDKGRELLQTSDNFKDVQRINDWSLLVERVLEWEAFLNESEMDAEHVIKLNRKNRYIMYLIKKTANRKKGMGLKLMKFHVIIHMWMDIWLYGVPTEVDTGSNESGHKITKIAAKLTQKNEATFDYQTSTRLDEFFLFDLAIAELEEGRQLWNYYIKEEDESQTEENTAKDPKTGGLQLWVYQEDKYGPDPVFSMGKGPESKEPCPLEWDLELVKFLFELQTKLDIEKLQINCQHKRGGFLFRGHPDFMEKPWRDWAMFDWEDGELPGQIWCFVTVNSIVEGDEEVRHADVIVQNETYAVVECAYLDQRANEMKKSEIFIPINKEVKQTAQATQGWKRKFYLATVESIIKPLVVVPNIGGEAGIEYLWVLQRKEWVDKFKQWLGKNHRLDLVGKEEPVPLHHIPAIVSDKHPGTYLDF